MITEQSDICNFADDNTLYSCGVWLTEVKENLIFEDIIKLVQIKFIESQPWKIHILKINSIKVEASDDVLLLGMTIEKKSTFKQHIENLCPKGQYI